MNYNVYQEPKPTPIRFGGAALPYGEMPNDALVSKYEETIDYNDGEDEYDNYARGTLKDQAPEPVSMEQDLPRRNYNSKGFLNLLHRGGRGLENAPNHSEMFLELTENEPRGVNIDPDMRKLVDQEKARMRFVRFGNDADNSISEGRWDDKKAFRMARYLTHKAAKARAMIFSTSLDGRREGMRRDYYKHKSNVNKVEEDLNKFRPSSQTFTDYITDEALSPQRKTTIISNTIIRNTKEYHRFTTDHEFKVGAYGEDARRRRSLYSTESVVPLASCETKNPDTECIEGEDPSKAYKAAGILMGALVEQKFHTERDTKSAHVYDEGASKRKTMALMQDLSKVMYEIITHDDTFVGSRNTLTGAKTAAPVQAGHLLDTQETQHTKPANMLHNAELIYKSMKQSADMDEIRSKVITDDSKEAQREDMTTFGKAGTRTTKTGVRNAVVEVDGKSLTTATYKTSGRRIGNDDTKLMVRTTELFAGKSDTSQIRRPNHAEYRTTIAEDLDGEYDVQFHNNLSKERYTAPMGKDKFGLSRFTEKSGTINDISANA
jgi:hypothetical protein